MAISINTGVNNQPAVNPPQPRDNNNPLQQNQLNESPTTKENLNNSTESLRAAEQTEARPEVENRREQNQENNRVENNNAEQTLGSQLDIRA